MDILFVLIIEVLFMLPIICIQTFLYFKTIGPSQKWKGLRLALAVLFVTAIEAALQLVSLRVAFWVQFLAYATIILYPVFFMGGKFKERIFFGIANFAIFLFASLLSIVIVYTKSTDMPETLWETLLLGALIITIHGILVLVITHLNTEGKRYMPRKYWTGSIICFSIIFSGFLS